MDKTCKKIKKKEIPNDVFITPLSLVKKHLSIVAVDMQEKGVILDAFYGTGHYYNALKELYPDYDLQYTEIKLGKNFFDFDGEVDYIISNPPYSCIDEVLKKSCELKPIIISYLIGFMNLTTRRIEFMNQQGYYMKSLHLTKVFKWFGMSAIVTFSNKITTNCISFDRQVHR